MFLTMGQRQENVPLEKLSGLPVIYQTEAPLPFNTLSEAYSPLLRYVSFDEYAPEYQLTVNHTESNFTAIANAAFESLPDATPYYRSRMDDLQPISFPGVDRALYASGGSAQLLVMQKGNKAASVYIYTGGQSASGTRLTLDTPDMQARLVEAFFGG